MIKVFVGYSLVLVSSLIFTLMAMANEQRNTTFITDGKPFITTWKTDNRGFTEDNQIKIGTQGAGYDYRVDWGDGRIDQGVTGDIIHTYEVAGTYSISISGDFPRIYFDGAFNNNDKYDNEKLISIDQWGDIQWRSMEKAFYLCSQVESNAVDTPDLSKVNNMNTMFFGAKAFNGDISQWDVSKVFFMSWMFALTEKFNQDISDWDVSNVVDMSWMFAYTGAFDQGIGNWDVSNLLVASNMFYGAQAFNKDISDWNVSNVTHMKGMFAGAYNFNQPIGEWDVSNVRDLSDMFMGARSFNQDVGSWNVSNVVNMKSMFYQAWKFNQDIGRWDVSRVTRSCFITS